MINQRRQILPAFVDDAGGKSRTGGGGGKDCRAMRRPILRRWLVVDLACQPLGIRDPEITDQRAEQAVVRLALIEGAQCRACGLAHQGGCPTFIADDRSPAAGCEMRTGGIYSDANRAGSGDDANAVRKAGGQRDQRGVIDDACVQATRGKCFLQVLCRFGAVNTLGAESPIRTMCKYMGGYTTALMFEA